MSESCPYCDVPDERVVYSGRLVVGLWAFKPIMPGHVVLVPRRHVGDWFAASAIEQRELTVAITAVRDIILERFQPDGFNITIDVGVAAGADRATICTSKFCRGIALNARRRALSPSCRVERGRVV